MGVDYLTCNSCCDTFPDCGTYVSCETCGNHWCSKECANEDGYQDEKCKLGYDCDDNECEISCWRCENHVDSSCAFCRKEDFEDSELLFFALSLLQISRDELVEKYKAR